MFHPIDSVFLQLNIFYAKTFIIWLSIAGQIIVTPDHCWDLWNFLVQSKPIMGSVFPYKNHVLFHNIQVLNWSLYPIFIGVQSKRGLLGRGGGEIHPPCSLRHHAAKFSQIFINLSEYDNIDLPNWLLPSMGMPVNRCMHSI